MPCTTLLAGKKATFDGSTMMARNEDSAAGHFTAKKFIVVNPQDQPKKYKSVISGVEIELPDNPMRYTAVPNALPDEGIWGEAGINECNVAMSETETITSNPRVLGADPLVKTGIGEEDMLTIVLPYIKSARDGVERLGALLEQYGTYEMNGIGFQDQDEIWWFESIGGHHWIAKRVPDDAYVVMPNQQGIDFFDFTDAYGAQDECMCSRDMADFIEKNHLDLSVNNIPVRKNEFFEVRAALGSHSDSDHVYNTPRAWYMLRCLNPHTYNWDGGNAEFSPESDDLPWCLIPEHKLTIEDFKYILSSYYQGTKYNPYGRGDSPDKGKYRVIGINRNNFLSVTQIRPGLSDEIRAVQWLAFGSNAFNTIVPFYANVRSTPVYLSNTDKETTTENFYWANRLIGALADAHFGKCLPFVERYQLQTLAKGHNLLKKSDEEYLEHLNNPDAEKNMCSDKEEGCPCDLNDVQGYLEECNEKMADMIRQETYQLLDKVLFAASSEMKNAFSRSDN